MSIGFEVFLFKPIGVDIRAITDVTIVDALSITCLRFLFLRFLLYAMANADCLV